MTSYQQTTYGHRKLSPLKAGGKRYTGRHRTTESIDLNSPPLSPASSSDPWCIFDFTWDVKCSARPRVRDPHISWPVSALNLCKTFALLYVFLSATYCSIRVLVWFHNIPSLEHLMRHVHSGHTADRPLDMLLDDSAGFRLSKLVTIHPLAGISDLHLDFIRPKSDAFHKNDITACLHITEEDIALVPQWLEAWNGPISLTVSIPHQPGSSEYADAISRLRKLSSSHPALHKALSIHALPVSTENLQVSTNARLNLARLYSQTSRVALFADGTLTHQPSPMQLLKESTPFDVSFYHSGEGNLPVIILPRNATRWCPERWFGAEVSDFDQCLWLFMLHFGRPGDVEYLKLGSSSDDTASAERSKKKLNILKQNYQAEACMMAAREQVALGLWADRKPSSRGDWIEKMCQKVRRLPAPGTLVDFDLSMGSRLQAFDPSGSTLLEPEPPVV